MRFALSHSVLWSVCNKFLEILYPYVLLSFRSCVHMMQLYVYINLSSRELFSRENWKTNLMQIFELINYEF